MPSYDIFNPGFIIGLFECRTNYRAQRRNDGVAAASSDGGPTGGRGPPTVLFYFKLEGRGTDLKKVTGAPDGCVTPLTVHHMYTVAVHRVSGF